MLTAWGVWGILFSVIVLADIPQFLTEPNWVEYATLAIGVILSLTTGTRYLYKLWLEKNYFELTFPVPHEGAPRGQPYKHHPSINLQLGKHTILASIRPREGINFRRFDIRFVVAKGYYRRRFSDDLSEHIKLVKVSGSRSSFIDWNYCRIEPNEADGFRGDFTNPILITADERLTLQLTIEVLQEGEVYLSFRSHVQEKKRCIARAPITLNSLTHGTPSGQPSTTPEAYPETDKGFPGSRNATLVHQDTCPDA
jgi:hypothetical protein